VSGERLIRHSRRCWRLPLPALQELLERHSFWAQGRSPAELRRMLQGSQAVVSAWQGQQLVGFGRASSGNGSCFHQSTPCHRRRHFPG
jgi:hypothetical protein